MADFQALGGVSATLQTLLLDRMELPDHIGSAAVTSGPPPPTSKDKTPQAEEVEHARLNLFLYRVTENGYLQNQEIPGRGSPSAYGHPPLSLNLHYLVTPYGNAEAATEKGLFNDADAQFLLGSAMRVLHDVPIVTENLVTVRPLSGRTILHESLRHEFERVKLTLEPLTLEDVTKVWTALGLRYRLSAAYVVNVVQIESRRQRHFPKPVGQPISPTIPPFPTDPPSPGPWVYALIIQTPTITSVAVRRGTATVEQPYPYANVEDTLILRGTSLSGPVTRVAFGDVIVDALVARGDRVEVKIPNDPHLQPGPRTVRVIVSDPLVPPSAFSSNDAAFMLVPFIDPSTLVYTPSTRALRIRGTRLIGVVPGGETVIGRKVVPFDDYFTVTPATPMEIVVRLPDSFPAVSVQAHVGAALADPIRLTGRRLRITIGTTTKAIAVSFPTTPIAVADVAVHLARSIRDAGAARPATLTQPAAAAIPALVDARVAVWRDATGPRLILVPGGLTTPIQIGSTDGIDQELGLNVPAITNAALSGELSPVPSLSSPVPRLTVAIGAQAPSTLTLSKPASLAALAADLQTQIRTVGAGGAIYTNAIAAAIGSQILVVPGAAGNPGDEVAFAATPDDSTTVQELQWLNTYSVRVRVNGAESVDPPSQSAVVRLPR